MAHTKQKRGLEIQDSIQKILFQDWDPIGVNSNLNLQDEYDGYIAPVYRILIGSRSEEDLIEFLCRTERETIGTGCESREQLRSIARRLLALDVSL